MLGTFWQPCPRGGGGERERERETTTSSWLNLECNHIWYSSSFWKDKPSSLVVGLLSKSEIQIGLPFILAKNYTSLRKTMREKWLLEKVIHTVFEDGFRISLLEVLNFFVCFSSTFDNFGYFADLFQTSKRSAVVSAKDNLSSSSIVQSYTVSNSTEVFS